MNTLGKFLAVQLLISQDMTPPSTYTPSTSHIKGPPESPCKTSASRSNMAFEITGAISRESEKISTYVPLPEGVLVMMGGESWEFNFHKSSKIPLFYYTCFRHCDRPKKVSLHKNARLLPSCA